MRYQGVDPDAYSGLQKLWIRLAQDGRILLDADKGRYYTQKNGTKVYYVEQLARLFNEPTKEEAKLVTKINQYLTGQFDVGRI